jgi:hypothetical protein
MSFKENSGNRSDNATQALWRAAEAGQLDELEAVLPRVADINARNEHGVTALMRAAQHGHVRVVRLLLANGADANITRNDRFTALALAAFFGHTEVVRSLMEHGADSQAPTRQGTSPHMWATARTFNEVVDQLKKPAPVTSSAPVTSKERVAAPAATPRTPARAARPPDVVAAIPPVVRTLKDPPEIWDLVHEVPKGFNARSAFVARLKSMRSGFAFRVATAAVLIGACTVGVLVLRGAQARSEGTLERPSKPPAARVDVENRNLGNGSQPAAAAAAAAPAAIAPPANIVAPPVVPVATENTKAVTSFRRGSRSLPISSHRVAPGPTEPAAASASVQPTLAPKSEAETQVRSNPAAPPKNSTPLSPQLITPAKSAAPKAKVIQWP